MSRIADLLKTPPYYYARSKDEFNVDNIVSLREWFNGVAEKLDEIDSVLSDIELSRSIDQATDYGLDGVANRVGLKRREGETDDQLRQRVKREVFIQESHGAVTQLKKIVGWFLEDEGGFVRTPEDEIDQDYLTQAGQLRFKETTQHSHTDQRDVERKDVFVYENEYPWWDLEAHQDPRDPEFGDMELFFVVDVPWTGLPFLTNQPFEPIADADESTFPNDFQNDPRSVGIAPLDVPKQEPNTEELETLISDSRAAGTRGVIHGRGGLIPFEAPSGDESNFTEDQVHGVGFGRIDGPLERLKDGLDEYGSQIWQEVQL